MNGSLDYLWVGRAPILLLERRRQGGYGLCSLLFLGSGRVFGNPWQGIGKVWIWPMASLFQEEGWKVTMTSALLHLTIITTFSSWMSAGRQTEKEAKEERERERG